jgi:hypothetical protein
MQPQESPTTPLERKEGNKVKDMDKAQWPDRTSCIFTGRSLASFALQVNTRDAGVKKKEKMKGMFKCWLARDMQESLSMLDDQ